IPEVPLTEEQIIVLQVPAPEPLRNVEAREYVTKRLHAENEYSGAWLMLFEQIMKYGKTATNADHPVLVHDRYVMAPSPIPRFDNEKMNQSKALILLGAGREKKIYAVPPFTNVQSLAFDDYKMEVENFAGKKCHLCQSEHVFLDELVDRITNQAYYQCNDTSFCLRQLYMNTQ